MAAQALEARRPARAGRWSDRAGTTEEDIVESMSATAQEFLDTMRLAEQLSEKLDGIICSAADNCGMSDRRIAAHLANVLEPGLKILGRPVSRSFTTVRRNRGIAD